MCNLTDALADLKADLLDAEHGADIALADVADAYEIAPSLLARKFLELHGVAVADYAASVRNAAEVAARADAATLAAAVEKAHAYHAANFVGSDAARPLIGRPFEFLGKRFVFVAFVRGSGPTAVAIRVSDCAVRNLRGFEYPDMLASLNYTREAV